MVGVSYRKDRDNWQVLFRKHGTRKYIFVGYYETEEIAMMAYDQYILDHNMVGYKMNKKRKPNIRLKNVIPNNDDSAIIPPPLI